MDQFLVFFVFFVFFLLLFTYWTIPTPAKTNSTAKRKQEKQVIKSYSFRIFYSMKFSTEYAYSAQQLKKLLLPAAACASFIRLIYSDEKWNGEYTHKKIKKKLFSRLIAVYIAFRAFRAFSAFIKLLLHFINFAFAND